MRRVILALALIGCEAKKEASHRDSSSPSGATSLPPVASGTRPQTSSCGEEVVVEEGIGDLRIGTTVESVRQKCNVVRDTAVTDSEGMPARRLTVAFSRDTVEAEIVGGKVWRIAVHAPWLRTADSLGVGTGITRLLQLKNPRGMTGEGKFFVASPEHCGMSFRLANAGPGAQRGDLDQAGLARLPKSSVVSEVLIFGCHLSSIARPG